MNILVVDDEKEIAELVEIYLKNENYNVDVCYTGTQALHNIRTHSYDLAILDVMLPDMDGFHICKTIKELNLTPIEFRLLWYLCERQGKVVSAKELYTAIWQEEYLSSSNNTLMVHIRHIREKMKDRGEHPRYIQNVWGVGYKLGETL